MKKGIKFLTVIILSMLMTSVFAQQAGGGQRTQRTPEETAKTTVDQMVKDLALNQATSTKVYDVVLKYAKQTTAARQALAGGGGDREAVKAKMTEITTARDKELKAILGDKPFETWQTKEKERRAARQGGGA
jgi:hypothetical protein